MSKIPKKDLALLSVGRTVRVQCEGGVRKWRRAIIDCIDEDDRTADVTYLPFSMDKAKPSAKTGAKACAQTGGAKASTLAKKKMEERHEKEEEEEEADVPEARLKPLEEFETSVAMEEKRQRFAETPNAAATTFKDQGNMLFKLGDLEAAADCYGEGLEVIENFTQLIETAPEDGDRFVGSEVLTRRGVGLALARVAGLEASSKTAKLDFGDGDVTKERMLEHVPWRTLLAVWSGPLLSTQVALHMNRARCLMQLELYQEAAADLTVVIALAEPRAKFVGWFGAFPERLKSTFCRACTRQNRASTISAGQPAEDNEEQAKARVQELLGQSVKAFCMRAKSRLARMRLPLAKQDLIAARTVLQVEGCPQDMANEIKNLDAKVLHADKQLKISNRKLQREICKYADAAMSNLSEEQMSSMGEVAGLFMGE